jgi:TRAP-type C4-dicarboxylate transport system substrate-binding protein
MHKSRRLRSLPAASLPWRAVFAAAAVALLMTVVAACGGGEPEAPASSGASGGGATAPEPTAMAAEPTAAMAENTPVPPTQTPLPAAATQEALVLQVVCINRTLRPCELIRDFYAPKVSERTNGEVTVEISSYPELGLAGPDTIRLVADQTLEFAEIYSGYVGGDLPIIDVGNLWGLSPSNDAHLELTDAIEDDMIRILRDSTGGEPIFRAYYPNQYVFSGEPLPDLASYKDKNIRQHSTILGDLLAGLGAAGQFVAFADVYTALERGVLDAGITGGTPGYGQRWYEVTDYLYGPIVGSIGVTYVTVNGDKWRQLTAENREILKEVGKEYEAENLRLLKTDWDPAGISLNVAEGMEYSDFPDDVKAQMRDTALNAIIPNWVERAGGADSEGVNIFNEKVGPIVGVVINPDGTASETEAMMPSPASSDAMASKTQLVTQGESFEFQMTCINRTVAPCELLTGFFIPEVAERTNGQVQMEVSSYPELGIAGPDTLRLVGDNTLELSIIYSGYVGGDLPILDIGNLWGLSPSEEAHLALADAIDEDLVSVLQETTGGQPILRQYYPNQFLFSRDTLRTVADFEGKKIRQHSTVLGDLLAGLGAEGQFVAFADVYTSLERGVMDAGVTAGEAGHSQRWYEVTDYLTGPIVGSVAVAYLVMSGDRWDTLPPDIQQIMLEVGKEYDDLARKTLIEEWNPFSISANVEAGMTHEPFSDEVQARMREIALDVILPNWVERTGGPDSDAVKLYNEKVASILGVVINPDGSASETAP